MGRNKEFQQEVDKGEAVLRDALKGLPEKIARAAMSQTHRKMCEKRKALKELSQAKWKVAQLEKKVQ